MSLSNLQSYHTQVRSKIIFHGLGVPDLQDVCTTTCPSPTDQAIVECGPDQLCVLDSWNRFKLFLLDHHKPASIVKSLFLLELESYIVNEQFENKLGISADDLRNFDILLAKFEDKCIPRLFLKFERFKLLSLQPQQFDQSFDWKCTEEDYIKALKVIFSFCGFAEMENSFLHDVISRDDVGFLSKEKLTRLLHSYCSNRESKGIQDKGAPSAEKNEKENIRSSMKMKLGVSEVSPLKSVSTPAECLSISSRTRQKHRLKDKAETAASVNVQKDVREARIPSHSGDRPDSVKKSQNSVNYSVAEDQHVAECISDMNKLPLSPNKYETDLRGRRKTTGIAGSSSSTLCSMVKDRYVSCKCPVCGSEFKNIKMIKSHLKSHIDSAKHICPTCGSSFKQRSSLKDHLESCSQLSKAGSDAVDGQTESISKLYGDAKARHNGHRSKHLLSKCKQSYSCGVCHKTFSGYSNYRCHVKSHSKVKTLTCDICHTICQSQAKLARHKRTHTGEKPFHCHTCRAAFADRSHLNVHLRTHSGEKPFKCNVCEASFSESTKLKNHKRVHTGEKPFVCEVCGSSFSVSSSLRSHMKIHSGQKPYKCDVCDFASVHPSNLKTHMLVHTGEKKHTCEKCGASFTETAKLRRHKMIHTGERPYSCEVCGTRFADKSHLTVHLRIHSGVKPFKCTYCTSCFNESSKLKNHLRTHTGEKPYICYVCGLSFAVSYSLKSHMRRHTGEKPYKCEICGYATSQSSNLKTHMVVHNGKRPHICDECDASFSEPSKLNRHRQVHLDAEETQGSSSQGINSAGDVECHPLILDSHSHLQSVNRHSLESNQVHSTHLHSNPQETGNVGTKYIRPTLSSNTQTPKLKPAQSSNSFLGIRCHPSFSRHSEPVYESTLHQQVSNLDNSGSHQGAVAGSVMLPEVKAVDELNDKDSEPGLFPFSSLYKGEYSQDTSLHIELSSL